MAKNTPAEKPAASALLNALTGHHRPSYWEALGRFIHQFAYVEAGLFFLLRARAGVSLEVARSIFSGTRTEAAIDLVRRINEAKTSKRADPALESVFAQIKIITKARNDIIHFGALLGDDYDRKVTNAIKALTAKHVEEMPISPESLGAMANDSIKIYVHLSVAAAEVGGRENPLANHPVLKAAWQYKPPLPKTAQRKTKADRKIAGKPK